MFSLRCTQKLLARLGAAPALQAPVPDTVLGDWLARATGRSEPWLRSRSGWPERR